MTVFQGALMRAGSTGPAQHDPAPTVEGHGAEAPDATPHGAAPDPASMTVAQLRALCDERGIRVAKKATKAQLLAALAE